MNFRNLTQDSGLDKIGRQEEADDGHDHGQEDAEYDGTDHEQEEEEYDETDYEHEDAEERNDRKDKDAYMNCRHDEKNCYSKPAQRP
jgi:hypothetical protein